MVRDEIIDKIKQYLHCLAADYGIHASKAVLFGSMASGAENPYSDIDLLVIAPELDDPVSIETVRKLWRATSVDSRIEPVPCGEKEWQQEGGRIIVEIAREDGIEIAA